MKAHPRQSLTNLHIWYKYLIFNAMPNSLKKMVKLIITIKAHNENCDKATLHALKIMSQQKSQSRMKNDLGNGDISFVEENMLD